MGRQNLLSPEIITKRAAIPEIVTSLKDTWLSNAVVTIQNFGHLMRILLKIFTLKCFFMYINV